MRQFDVAPNPDAGRRPAAPYLVILQSHLLYGLGTVVVAPMRRMAAVEGIGDIQAPVGFEGETYAVMVAELAHMPVRMLKESVGSVKADEDAIRGALSRLFTGF